MHKTSELLVAAQDAFQKVWFVQAFIGEITGSLYFALIEGRYRIFGMDRESGEWHDHPFGTPEKHENLEEGLDPKPLLKFLSRVEEILLEENLI